MKSHFASERIGTDGRIRIIYNKGLIGPLDN